MDPITFKRLLPEPGELSVHSLLDGLEVEPQRQDRPYTIVNFVTSVDGRATYEGRSGALGDDGDRVLFHSLRERVDAVIAGTTTLAIERYGRILGKPERRERRVAAGRTPEPLACVISRSGRVPWEIPLFAEPEAEVVVFSPSEPDHDEPAAKVHWEPLDGGEPRPLSDALGRLRRGYGVQSLLCEGGPTLFSALLSEGLVDELFLTVSPKLAGGGHAIPITSGLPLPELAPLRLRWLLERENSLYLRYAVG
jgi:riboflavin biosynthesis pyrimidine reductase